jgi:CHAT domain-containing protein
VFDRAAVDDPFAAHLILQDGTVDALSISQWRLDAEVVVLSACDSGQRALGGRGLAELPGDDLFGLQAALFEAGARSVVGALWPVDDRVAPGIMARLHEGLAAGVAPDLALQAALLDYLAQPDARRRIYFWAPLFVTSLGRLAGAPGQENHRA